MKKLLLLVAFILIGLYGIGQNAAQYIFSQSVGSYTAIVGGTTITPTGVTYFDDYSYGPFNIGFNFTWRGTVYTQFGLNENGFINLGASAPTSSYYSLSTGSTNDVIAAFNYDLYGLVANGAEIRYQTLGSAPNRSLVVQYKNYGFYSAGLADFNFQIQLYETSNVVKIVYGTYAATSISNTLQVGLRGASNADFNNRTTTTNWSATTAGGTNAATCSYTPPGVIPASGLTFTWTPPPPCVAPTAQPTALVLTPFATSINGSFTAASPAADDYLVVRSLSSTLSATPVNGVTYVPGASFGGGTIVSYGTSNTFSAGGLSLNTLYYFFIFSANDATCLGGPLYLTTSPLTGSMTTLPGITGIKTIPGDYATIALAIAAINTNGVGAGGVTFNVAPGYTETFLTPTAGLVTTITPTAANPCVFRKNGAGANPLVTAPVGVGSYDYIIAFAGTDYITFDGIDVQESAANLTTTTQMEWGYAVLKASAIDGSQNVTVKNCTITLNKTNTSTYGIYSNNVTPAAPTVQLTVTTATGTNSSNKFYGNTITNSYGGIYVYGFSDPNFPYLYYDQNTEIGVSGANTFTNLGGGASSIYGMYLYYQNGLKVANNVFSGTFTSGVGVSVYMIYLGAATNANLDVYGNNLTFTYTGTTSTIYGIYNGIGSSGVNNTVNIYNNTVSINFATATTGTQYSIYQSSSAYNFNCYGNNVNNNVIGSAGTVGTGTWAGIYTFGGNSNPGSFWNIYNNNVNGNSRVQSLFSTGSSYGIYNSSSGFNLTVYNNNVNNNSWPSSSACYGIYLSTSALNMIVRKNTLNGDSKPNAVVNVLPRSAALYGILVSNAQINNATVIDSNNVYNLTNTWGGQILGIRGDFGSTGTGNIYSNSVYNITANDQAIFGIYNTTGLVNNVYKNNLYNLGANIGDSASFYGICTGSTTAYAVTNVYNNFISDLRAPQAVNYLSAGLYGFNGAATGIIRYYYNTVYINQTPNAGSPATSAIYVSTVPMVEMRNNIFYNNSGIIGGGITIGVWRSSVSPATYSNFSNSNCIYAGTPGATNVIFFDFTNADQTIAAYKARFPQEATSFTEVPPFVNVAVAPYNLHMQTTVPTQCESGGQPITTPAITTDYDNQARSATTPDVGADEFAGLPSDQSPPTINFTPLSNGPVAVTRTFPNVSVIDPSGVNTTSGLRPRCYYKKSVNANTFNDNTSATDGWKWVEATGTTSPFTFNINYALLSGGSVANGDVIQYFIDAQDLAGTVHVGMRLGSFTTQPATVNLAAANFPINGTIYQYTIIPTSIGGTVTVGTGGTYPNLTGATGLFQAINASVVTGNITANIISDLVEDGTNALNQWIEDVPGANYTLLIQPDAAVSRNIAGTYAGGLIRLNGADRVTFNGNFSGAGNWLNFANTAASGTVSVFSIMSLGTTLGATNNTIRNCNIKGGFNSSGSYGIFIGSTTIGTAGDDNDNTTILGNVISKVYYGIYAYANSTGFNDNLLISNNTIGSATATDYIGYYGLYLYGANAPVISGNEIFNLITTTNTASIGMEISSYVINGLITQNKIHDIQNNNSGGWGAYGIDFNSTTFNIGNQVTNNLIYNVTTINYSTASTTYNPFGIRLTGGNGTKLYHNTVRMTGTQFASGASGTLSAALCITSTSVTGLDAKDNIFTNNIIGLAGSLSYAVYMPLGTPFATMNYNDYFASGAYGILGYLGVNILTLPAWQTATAQDVNSVNVDPVYVSGTDLHPTAAGLMKTGLFLASVPVDFTGAGRTNPPDIGAYQFSANPAVVTTAASGITLISATINGTINANNATVASSFEYGLTAAYGSTIIGVPASVTGSSVTPISAALSGLTPCTLYHYRAKGISGGLTVYGGDLTFNTANGTPLSSTNAATVVTGTTATLNGVINANLVSTTVTFDYGLTTAYGTTVPGNPSPVTGNSPTPVFANITGLLPGNTYHYQVKGVNACGTGLGGDMTFTTPALAPTVVTTAATNITTTTATVNGTVTANGASTAVTFEYGTTIAYGTIVPGVPTPVVGNTPTTVLANLVGLANNTTYHYRVNGQNSVGLINGNDMTFSTNCPVSGPAGPITGPTQVCQGQCGYVYSVTIPNATGYVWTLPVGGTITSGANTNTITVCYAANSAPGYVFVYGTAPCGNGAPSQLAVAMNPPAAPTISGPASVCLNSAGNVYSTQSGMSNYIWTVSAGGNITAGGGTNAITVTWTTTGAKTVSVNYNTAAGCPALAPTVYNVTVNALPAPTISGPSPACSNYPGLVYSTQTGMSGYTWSISAGGLITAGQGTSSITVTWNTTGAQSVSVNYTNSNGCTAAAPVVYPVTVNPGAAPTITGSTSLCVNSGYYTYTTEAGMTAYLWNISPGGVINFGSGTNVITVSWAAAGAQWVSVNYTNPGGCSAINPTILNVTVNAPPAAAGSITGTAAVCGGANAVVYSVSAVSGAVSYVWTLPAGASIATGAGTNVITVNFAGNASSGNITVYANNLCGNGASSPPFAVTVTQLPGDAGTITGPATVCEGATGAVYTVSPIAGATGYGWTVPTGATIMSGGNTNSIVVDYAIGAASGNITVLGTNSCGNGVVSPNFPVTVNTIPAAPVVTNTGTTLTSSAPTGNQWYYSPTQTGTGTLITGATGQTYVATQDGYYWSVVTINGCSSDESNRLLILTTGVGSHASSSINIYPVPNDGQFNVSITTPSDQTFSISVYNGLGVKIYEESKVDVNGSLKKVIDLRPVPNGVYSVVFENSLDQVVKKIIVNK